MSTVTQDRRRKPRVTFWSRISLEAPDGAISASLRNVSLAGMCCTTSTPFPEMTRIQVALDIPVEDKDEPPTRMQLEGAVVRCTPLRRGNSRRRYEVAVFFDRMDPGAKAKLAEFVKARQPR